MTGTAPAPLRAPVVEVQPGWIDYNGHMNVAYYLLVFDKGIDHVFSVLGLGPDLLAREQRSTFTLQSSLWFRREVKLGDPLEVRARLMGFDAKRLHIWMDMVQTRDGYLAAECEQVTVHVDMTTRRSAPFPDSLMATISDMAQSHAKLPKPAASGTGVTLEKRTPPATHR